ncbi:MAG: glycosyltransferase family 39 protein [Planctomycetota bacterium]|nr:glycosyltransferase family 39 protein [Planctomycetota bacterium]
MSELRARDFRPAWPGALALAAVYLFASACNLSIQRIEKPDEPRYCCPARDLAEARSGEGCSDWIVPKFNGEQRLKKPVLIYWTLALFGIAGRALGFELATAFRAMPVFFGLLGVLFTYGLGRRLYGSRTGLLAGLALCSTYFYESIVREILIDPMLTAFLAGAWYCFVVALQKLEAGEDRAAGWPLLGFYLFLGLACQAKGPPLVGIFAVVPACAYLLWERKRYASGGWLRLLWRSRVWYGAPLALIVGMFWFYALWKTGEWHAVRLILEQENLQRAMGKVDHNSGIRVYPFVFYVQNVPLHFLPWALLFFPAFWWSARNARNIGPEGRLLACALLIPWFIMGAVGSKRSVYMLPLYPFFALWLARAWDAAFLSAPPGTYPRLERCWKAILALIAVLTPLGALAVAAGGYWKLGRELPLTGREYAVAALAAVALGCGAAYALRALRGERRWAASLAALLLVAGLCFVKEATIRAAQERNEPKREFFAGVREHLGGARLAWYGGSGNEGAWYLDRIVHEVTPWDGMKEFFFESPVPSLLLVRGKEFDRDHSAPLREAVSAVARLDYGGKDYYLVKPKDGARPDPALYKPPPGIRRDEDEVVDPAEWVFPILFIVAFLGLGYHAWRAGAREARAVEGIP